MSINNDAYGGFVVSNNILNGVHIKYSFREKSNIAQLNGWTFYSVKDDDEYIRDSKNFVIQNAESFFKIAPVMLELFEAPYGTDLCWLYEEGVHIGFFDLKLNQETSIKEVLSKE